jgi:hypothetical protein
LIAHARNIDPLEMSMNNSKVYLEELKMKKDIGIVSEGEYMAKEPKFRWEIDHYRDEILRRKKSLEALEDPTSVMPPEKINQMRRQMDHCLNEIDQLNTVYRISQETRDRVMDLLLEMHRYFNNFSVGGQRQSDGLTPDFEPPIKEEIFETRENASNEELEEAVKSEERRPILPEDTEQVPSSSEPDTEKGPQLTRVECPYDNKGKKCRVKAFGGSEFDAYKKLEAHVEKHHPEKVDEFNMTKLKKF